MQRIVIATFVWVSSFAFAQNASYRSSFDDLVTVRKITLLPVFDNLRGIYARPIETHLIETLTDSHRWDYTTANVSGPIQTPDELEDNPETVRSLSRGLDADAFISVGITKGPSGIAIKMDLFLKADQKLIAQEVQSEIQRFDVESIKKHAADMMNKLISKLPYEGMILSRQGTRVTINLGKKDGLSPDQIISVIQIINITRHPKFNFLISTEKEVIGKVKVLKVDDTLSFAHVVSEKERGAIQVNAKLSGLDNVVYSQTGSLSDSAGNAESLGSTPQGKITFGENPIAWLPTKKPTFGMVGAQLGLGTFREHVKDSTALDTNAPLYPLVSLEGELWLTPTWSLHARMYQGIISTNNPRSGASPGTLSHALSSYDFLFGYNLRLSAALNAPHVEALFGYSVYRLYVDESTPAGLTTKSYSGVKMGVTGAYPLSNSSYSLGASLDFLFNSKLAETPSTSGSSDNSVNSFGFFAEKLLSINLKARACLDFKLYSSTFSGSTVSSSSQKHTTLSTGIFYLF